MVCWRNLDTEKQISFTKCELRYKFFLVIFGIVYELY